MEFQIDAALIDLVVSSVMHDSLQVLLNNLQLQLVAMLDRCFEMSTVDFGLQMLLHLGADDGIGVMVEVERRIDHHQRFC
jgi:hypothetical protein